MELGLQDRVARHHAQPAVVQHLQHGSVSGNSNRRTVSRVRSMNKLITTSDQADHAGQIVRRSGTRSGTAAGCPAHGARGDPRRRLSPAFRHRRRAGPGADRRHDPHAHGQAPLYRRRFRPARRAGAAGVCRRQPGTAQRTRRMPSDSSRPRSIARAAGRSPKRSPTRSRSAKSPATLQALGVEAGDPQTAQREAIGKLQESVQVGDRAQYARRPDLVHQRRSQCLRADRQCVCQIADRREPPAQERHQRARQAASPAADGGGQAAPGGIGAQDARLRAVRRPDHDGGADHRQATTRIRGRCGRSSSA